jgi:hypothetical protein
MNKELVKAKETISNYKTSSDAEKMYILYGISNSKVYGPQRRYLLDLIDGKTERDNQTALKMWIDTYKDVNEMFDNILKKLDLEAQFEEGVQ